MADPNKLFNWQNKILDSDPVNSVYLLPMGINVGNNATKAYVNPTLFLDGKILLPSRLAIRDNLPETMAERDTRTNSVFAYLGNVAEYKGKFILLGSENTGEDSEELGRSPGRKVEEILILILAVINKVVSNSSLSDYSDFYVPLFISVPNKNQNVADKVSGTHRIAINGDGREVNIILEVNQVLTESQAASVLLNIMNQQERIAVIDFGNGTTIFSATAKSGLSLMHDVELKGVRSLIDSIRYSKDAQEFNGQNPVGYSYVQTALERGQKTIIVPSRGKWDFESIYDQEFAKWFEDRMKYFSNLISPKDLNVKATYAIGGGSLLPGIKEQLDAKGIETIEDPQFIDAIALSCLSNNVVERKLKENTLVVPKKAKGQNKTKGSKVKKASAIPVKETTIPANTETKTEVEYVK